MGKDHGNVDFFEGSNSNFPMFGITFRGDTEVKFRKDFNGIQKIQTVLFQGLMPLVFIPLEH